MLSTYLIIGFWFHCRLQLNPEDNNGAGCNWILKIKMVAVQRLCFTCVKHVLRSCILEVENWSLSMWLLVIYIYVDVIQFYSLIFDCWHGRARNARRLF
jgi:hypothetical protein